MKSSIRRALSSLLELLQARAGPNRGRYASEADALAAAAARGRRIGYDNPEAADIYLHEVRLIRTSDYPVVYWLQKMLRPGLRIFDWGGNVGHSFYAFGNYLEFPPGVTWTICDVPEVTRVGEAVAREWGASGLQFTNDPTECDGADVLLISGALQYIPLAIGPFLRSLHAKPASVFINRTPVHATRGFFTLQDIGPAVCPYQIFAESQLIGTMAELGYAVRDRWPCEGKSLRIPFHPDDTIPHYTGFLFEATIAGELTTTLASEQVHA